MDVRIWKIVDHKHWSDTYLIIVGLLFIGIIVNFRCVVLTQRDFHSRRAHVTRNGWPGIVCSTEKIAAVAEKVRENP